MNDLIKAAMKQWRPSVWASEKATKKKELLHDDRRWAVVAETVVPPPLIIIQVLQEHITSEPIQTPLSGSNATLG